MEELKNIEVGLKAERDSLVEFMDSRSKSYTNFLGTLNVVELKIRSLISVIHGELKPLQEEKARLEAEIVNTKNEHKKVIDSHEETIKQKTDHALRLDGDINEKSQKGQTIDRHNAGLVIEKRTLEKEIADLRGLSASLERFVRESQAVKEKLIEEIASLKRELSTLTVSVSDKKAEFAKVSTDVAVLETRLKQ